MTNACKHRSGASPMADRTALLAMGRSTIHHVREPHPTSIALSAPGGQ
ncbi:hypothetical protein ACH3XX_35045 [Streptomyces scabiei]|nr:MULTISPECIES: hypothetical protein [Streptomyces]